MEALVRHSFQNFFFIINLVELLSNVSRGCVSGKIMENLRKNLDPEGTGNYNWEALDGYEGDEKNSLDKSPDLQAKVRRCIEQGFIDPDDFNGDPEMNRLGETGLRTKESKKKMREDTITNKNRVEELEAEKAALQAQLDALAAKGKSDTKLEIKIEAAQDEIDAANKGASPVKAAQKAAAKKRAREEENDGEEKKPGKLELLSSYPFLSWTFKAFYTTHTDPAL